MNISGSSVLFDLWRVAGAALREFLLLAPAMRRFLEQQSTDTESIDTPDDYERAAVVLIL